MKWSFVIQQKIKAALLLGSIMLLVLASALLSRNNMEGIDKSFSSMYQDRLIPAVDMVYLTENLYRKRLLMERYVLLNEEAETGQVARQIDKHNNRINSLIQEFEKTYMVAEESKSLQAFQRRLREYAATERAIFRLCEAGNREAGQELFEGEGNRLFQHTILRLNELTQIQSSVGKELLRKSHSDVIQSEFLSTIQICMVIIVGLILMALIKGSKIINRDARPFHLN
jgi:hypothetical protein